MRAQPGAHSVTAVISTIKVNLGDCVQVIAVTLFIYYTLVSISTHMPILAAG